MKLKSFISIVTLVAVLVNFLLLIFGKNNLIVFWGVIIICAAVAYKVVPRL